MLVYMFEEPWQAKFLVSQAFLITFLGIDRCSDLLLKGLAELNFLTLHSSLQQLRFQAALLNAPWPFNATFHASSYMRIGSIR